VTEAFELAVVLIRGHASQNREEVFNIGLHLLARKHFDIHVKRRASETETINYLRGLRKQCLGGQRNRMFQLLK